MHGAGWESAAQDIAHKLPLIAHHTPDEAISLEQQLFEEEETGEEEEGGAAGSSMLQGMLQGAAGAAAAAGSLLGAQQPTAEFEEAAARLLKASPAGSPLAAPIKTVPAASVQLKPV